MGADLAQLLLLSTQAATLLAAVSERVPMQSRWLDALTAVAAGDFEAAADIYERIGSTPDEAWARLHAGGAANLARAADFYERVGANPSPVRLSA